MSDESIQQVDAWIREGNLSEAAGAHLKQWLTKPEYADFRTEIQKCIENGDLDELEDAFRTRIEFGTGGIRGKMGPGPNRINSRTIGEAAQGLAQYVLKEGGPDGSTRGVVVAHDTRNNSQRFARETAAVMAGNGVAARLFSVYRSTPELSFALRETGAVAGVVISASHNPPSDNGFKAYWSDGGQVVPPHDRNIIEEVKAVRKIEKCDFESAVQNGQIQFLGEDLDALYHRKLAGLTLSDYRDIRIVYTPLHGVGSTFIVPVLEALGYRDLHVVAAQNVPDGNFPTVSGGVANPEEPRTLTLAIQDAAKLDADIVLASDPDADRLGCALPHPQKGWNAPPEELALNGNQIGAILCHYILQQKQNRGELPARGVVCKTIVTTDLISLIARSFGVRPVDNLLVGFKYIADVILNLEPDEVFLYGTEESHGYLAEAFVRDKDAAAAAILLSECAANLKARGKTVRNNLDDIYEKYGYFRETQQSTYREGAQGNREIGQIMAGLRQNPPTHLGTHPVAEVVDHQPGERRNLKTGSVTPVEGASGNVLAFTLTDAGHTRVTARPSGTEPKIKYYVSATSADHPHLVGETLAETRASVDALAQEILDGILVAAEGVLESQK